jgi:chromosome segregation ATPase
MTHGGVVAIPGKTSKDSDFDRLESVIFALAKSHGKLREENANLQSELEEKGLRLKAIDSELLAANQRRQDAYKRIDELIAHLDNLDSQLAETGD